MRRTRGAPGLAAVFLAALGLLAAFSDFFSTHRPDEQDLERSFMPPTRFHFIDAAGRLHLRPFVYRCRLVDPLDVAYREDTSEGFPVRFFETGYRYSVLGFTSTSFHLVSAGTAEFLPLGADELGRDVWSRTLAGARTSLLVVVVGLFVCVVAGVATGSLAGAGGAFFDAVLMRFAEFVLALPALYVILAIRAALPVRLEPWKALILTATVIASVSWPPLARSVRGLVLQQRSSPCVEAARAVGASNTRLWRTHLLPALIPHIAAQLVTAAPAFLLGEVVLSFLDVGLADSTPSWGTMLRSLLNLRVLTDFRWNMAPLAFVFATLLCLNLMGRGRMRADGGRDR